MTNPTSDLRQARSWCRPPSAWPCPPRSWRWWSRWGSGWPRSPRPPRGRPGWRCWWGGGRRRRARRPWVWISSCTCNVRRDELRFSVHFSLDTTQTIWKFSRLKLVHKSLYLVFTFPALLLPWWGLRPRLPGGTWSWSLDRTGTRTPSPSTRQHLLFYFPHFYWDIICFSIIRSSNRIRYRSSSRDSIFHICIYIHIVLVYFLTCSS